MKSNVELLELYNEEKAVVVGDTNTRTELEEFPTFVEWKTDYINQYMETHKEVSIEEADALMDNIVKEADKEIEGIRKGLKPTNPRKVPTKAIRDTGKKVPAERKETKTSQAQKLFDEMYGAHSRKEIIAAFIEQVGMTKNGASTYYQQMKKAHYE